MTKNELFKLLVDLQKEYEVLVVRSSSLSMVNIYNKFSEEWVRVDLDCRKVTKDLAYNRARYDELSELYCTAAEDIIPSCERKRK